MASMFWRIVNDIRGPRVPEIERQRHALRYAAPGLVMFLARVSLLSSLFLPYWLMTLRAPQYPEGLHIRAYVNHLQGDVDEVDGLNHYIGMRPLNEAAQFERTMSIAAIISMVLLVEATIHIRSRWVALLALPAILFPVGFLLDLRYWMSKFGRELDPSAPLSTAIKPFVPPVLGTGTVGQFSTIASLGNGMILAIIASLLVIVGLILHRWAYKPLFDAERRQKPNVHRDVQASAI
jgi:hypothetical protein